MAKGAIQIIDPYFSLPPEQILEIVKEMGFDNVVVQFGEKINSVDELIDGLSKSRTYIPLVEVVTKIDEQKNVKRLPGIVYMCASKNIGIDEFKEAVVYLNAFPHLPTLF